MKKYSELSREELREEYIKVSELYKKYCGENISLNIARGKPSSSQIDIISDILNVLVTPQDCYDGKTDCRNYGEVLGLPSARAFWADLLGCRAEECICGGNSSLNLMYDTISRGYTHGLLHSVRPWSKEEKIKWLCPSPGYDRHFAITESFGAELVYVPMTENGPDMDIVEELVKDSAVKGIWCVPKYSNPEGRIYSEETEDRLASMETAAPDFTIMWDNAYGFHEFEGDFVPFRDMLDMCRKAGHPDRVIEFASSSKMTFPGSGISVMAMSEANVGYIKSLLTVQTICYDKVNQIRHIKYLKDKEHTLEIMKRHALALAPKFKAVLDIFERELAPLGIGSWTKPRGGYFITYYANEGLARRTYALCKAAGLTLTDVGACFPYNKDPKDSVIRIAPSYPPLSEVTKAMEVFCVSARLAALEKLM